MRHNIRMAATKAEKAFDWFGTTFEAKCPKATACRAKDRNRLLTIYDFPAEHRVHIRTTNPIESTFAAVRLRTRLTQGAERHWRTLNGATRLADVSAVSRSSTGEQKQAA